MGETRGDWGALPSSICSPMFFCLNAWNKLSLDEMSVLSGLPPALNSLAPSYTPELKLVIYVNEVHCPRNTTQRHSQPGLEPKPVR